MLLFVLRIHRWPRVAVVPTLGILGTSIAFPPTFTNRGQMRKLKRGHYQVQPFLDKQREVKLFSPGICRLLQNVVSTAGKYMDLLVVFLEWDLLISIIGSPLSIPALVSSGPFVRDKGPALL